MYVSKFGMPLRRIVFSFDQSQALSIGKGSWRAAMTVSRIILSWIMSGVTVVFAVVGIWYLNQITGQLISLRCSSVHWSLLA